MKAKLLALLMVLTVLPPSALAQAPGQPSVPPDETPGAPAPSEVKLDTALDKTFVPIREFECPPGPFEMDQVSGETTWQRSGHPQASDDCIAQWGQGSYKRGSESVLTSPGLPTRHLAASDAPDRALNAVATNLIQNGVDPALAARIVANLGSGCQLQTAISLGTIAQAAKAMCKQIVDGSSVFLQVPEDPAGLGALYLELHHAFDFTEPNANQKAPDGGWVEVRTPDGSWKRLDPIALYAKARASAGVLCAVTGPPTLAVNGLIGESTRTTFNEIWGEGHIKDETEGRFGTPGIDSPFAPSQFAGSSPLNQLPASQGEWENDCGGVVRSLYGNSTQFTPLTVSAASQQASPQVPPQGFDRLRPYPGTIRGEGPGFVGDTRNEEGELEFVDHWFDLTPYAGETIEVRFHATGGSGLGTKQGGWWVDDVKVRYGGPFKDLSIRLEAPQDGDSLPPGTTQVSAVVRNLGRAASQPAQVAINVGGATATANVSSLDPLEAQRVTVEGLALPSSGTAQVQAELRSAPSAQGRSTTGPYPDAYTLNNNATASVTVDTDHEVALDVVETALEEGKGNVTVEVSNEGNKPLQVPLNATLTPIDLVTREPRRNEAVNLGRVDTVMVPHSEEANAFGIADASRQVNTTIELPARGVFQLEFTTPLDDAVGTTFLTFDEAAPTALETPFASVVKGPTPATPRNGFELVGQEREGEPLAFESQLRAPITGPETRVVPRGDFALATRGEELPEDWTPAQKGSPVTKVRYNTGSSCADVEIGGQDLGVVEQGPENACTLRNASTFLLRKICAAVDDRSAGSALLGQCASVADAIERPANASSETTQRIITRQDASVTVPKDTQVPATLQAWNVRQHHVTIYGIGTGSDDPSQPRTKAIQQLRPRSSTEEVQLSFRHAADVNWTNGVGSKARVLVVPKGQIDLVEEMRHARNLTRQATAGLPSDLRNATSEVLFNSFVDRLFRTATGSLRQNQLDTYPGALCVATSEFADIALTQTSQICGNAQILEQIEGSCGGEVPDCDLTEQESSTYLRAAGEQGGQGFVKEFTRPTGWGNVTLDVTDIVQRTTTKNGEDRGFYVIFDLVTTTDFEEVLASSRAETDKKQNRATVTYTGTGNEDPLVDTGHDASARFGWSQGKRPIWTVDDPELSRVKEAGGASDDRFVTWSLCDTPSEPPRNLCPGNNILPPLDTRGWRPFPVGQAAPSDWRFDPLGGDPTSLDPGAFVWKGGDARLEQFQNGLRTIVDAQQPDPYTVLRSPTIDLSGFEKPVTKMHVKFGNTSLGLYSSGENPEDSIQADCDTARTRESGNVSTRTGWNLRVRVVRDNGTLSEPKTVYPVGGYHECSDVGEVPILFNGTAYAKTPHSFATSTDTVAGDPPFFGRNLCFPADSSPNPDPLRFCKKTELAFGDGQPVFALPMDWQDVTFDLSRFKGQEIRLEVHAFGVIGSDGVPARNPLPAGHDTAHRGALRIDDLSVTEGSPPLDLAVHHDKQRFIAPGTEERFSINITNQGAEPVETVTIRRTVVGDEGCQVTAPVTVTRRLFDPDTGARGLPPGKTVTIRDGQLAWEAPEEENRIFERRLHVSTRETMPTSAIPEAAVAHTAGTGEVTVSVSDVDDCQEDLDVDATVLQGDPRVVRRGTELTISRTTEETQTDGVSITTRPALAVDATDAHGVTGLPAYVTVPPQSCQKVFGYVDDTNETVRVSPDDDCAQDPTTENVDQDPAEETLIRRFTMQQNGTVSVDVQQSAPGSSVQIKANPADAKVRTVQLYLAKPEGRATADEDPIPARNGTFRISNARDVTLRGLAPGHYLGYVVFGGSAYKEVTFTIREQPEAGQDARPGNNGVLLRGETRSVPNLAISEVEVPSLVNVSEEVTFPVRIKNTGNVPLTNVSTTVTVQPFGFTTSASRIPLLEPGDADEARVTVEVPTARPVRLQVEATSDQGVGASTGAGILALEKTAVSAEPGDREHWSTGQTIQFGDGTRVPRDVNEALPLDATMDLGRSPLSALFLNHSGSLEESYDGIGLEWRDREGQPIQHQLANKLTSSHAGGVPGERTPAFTGELNASVAWSTDLPGAQAEQVDTVDASEWRNRGAFQLQVDDAFRSSFYLPTATLLGSGLQRSQVSHEVRVPLTMGEWCTITEEMIPQRVPFRIRTLERRLFSEPSSQSRGWIASVRLETGQLSGPVGPKILQGEPIVPLEDKQTTGWTSVTYEVQLGKLLPAVQANAVPGALAEHGPNTELPFADGKKLRNVNEPLCELMRSHSGFFQEDLNGLSNAQLVFELRTDPTSRTSYTQGALDVGWFLGDVQVPALGLEVDPTGGGHTAQRCREVPSRSWTDQPRSVMGCTEITTGSQAQIGWLVGEPEFEEDSPKSKIADETQHVQVVRFGGTTAQQTYGDATIEPLSALLENRTFQERPIDRTSGTEGDDNDGRNDLTPEIDEDDDDRAIVSPPQSGRFRYLDASTLLDLRAGTRGNLVLDVAASAPRGFLQVVAAPVSPGSQASEAAPHRVPWVPLDLVEDNNQDGDRDPNELAPGVEAGVRERIGGRVTQDTLCEVEEPQPRPPLTPLGATEERLVGPPPANATRIGPLKTEVDGETTSTRRVCVDLGPVAGELALVGVRVWLPESGDRFALTNASAWMITPQPKELSPQLRAMTDDTVQEGTYTLSNAAMLTMTPPFSHTVEANLSGTQDWRTKGGEPIEVLVSNGFPDLNIDVDEPRLDSRWTLSAKVNVTYDADPDAGTRLTFAHGSIPLDQETFEGSQELTIPWKTVREAFEDQRHVHENHVHTASWLTTQPVLPANVTSVSVDVKTEPQRLVDGQRDCPRDLDELASTQDLRCRLLGDLVRSDDTIHLRRVTERGLGQEPGVRSLDILPARAGPSAPRSAVVEIGNPSSSPVELRGNLSIEAPDGTVLRITEMPPTVVRPWQNATVRVPLELPSDPGEHTRYAVVADIGGETVVDGYRTSTFHESEALLDEDTFVLGNGVSRSAEAAKPSMIGETDDGVGYHFDAVGGQNNAYQLRTSVIDVAPGGVEDPDFSAQDLQDLLRDPSAEPLLVFQHQRDLHGNAYDPEDGDFAFLGVTACRYLEDEGQCGETVALSGWAPTRTEKHNLDIMQGPEQNREDVCTPEPGTADSNTAYGEGFGDGSPDPNEADEPIQIGSTGSGTLKPDTMTAWRTAAYPIPVSDWLKKGFAGLPLGPGDEVRFNIIVGTCNAGGDSEMIVDDVEIASARPVIELGANEVPIRPGTEKRYRFTISNEGAGSDRFAVVPGAQLPSGWQVRIQARNGSMLFDSTESILNPLHLEEGETMRARMHISVPGEQVGGQRFTLPLTAYAMDAPGLMSSGALNASAATEDADGLTGDHADPGQMTLISSRTDQPDLEVTTGSVQIEDAEVGRQAKIQFKIVNAGEGAAENVPIRVSVQGPSGFTELKSPNGEPLEADFAPGARRFFTVTWNPTKPGEHRLRIVADAPERARDLLVGDELSKFFGAVQETHECRPAIGCANVLDRTVNVEPLQQPELALRIDGVPDRIHAGTPTQLRVIVENNGGRTAHDATLTLSENGLLPIFDTLTIDLPPIEPGNRTVLTPRWTPVTPGEILLLGSVNAPGGFTGQRADGTSAGSDNGRAIPVTVDRSKVSVTLSEAIRTQPGQAHVVQATVVNDGTSAVRVEPATTRKRGVMLSPIVQNGLEVPAGEKRDVPMLGFAMLGTPPTTRTLQVPLSQGTARVDVTVLASPATRVVVDQRPVKPGVAEIPARVINEGNVPIDGTVELRGPGIHGSASVEIPVGGATNVTIPTGIAHGAEPGVHEIATHVKTDEASMRGHSRLRVLEAPAVGFDVDPLRTPLAGSAEGRLTVHNIGNQPLDGRLTLSGPVSLSGSPIVDLKPGDSSSYEVTWLSAANRTGSAKVLGFGDEVIGTTTLSPNETRAELNLLRVSTQPSVNLKAGMEVQVVGSVENAGERAVRNATLGITIDGQLYQTFTIEELGAGQTTVVSAPIELPRAGTLTIGLVDLAAFQRGERAGPATTVEVAEASLGIGTIAEVPTIPWTGIVLLLAAVAVGVRRR